MGSIISTSSRGASGRANCSCREDLWIAAQQSGTADHINTLSTRPMTQVLLVRTSLCWGTARYVSGNSFEYISNRDLKMSFEVGTVIFEMFTRENILILGEKYETGISFVCTAVYMILRFYVLGAFLPGFERKILHFTFTFTFYVNLP